jgi:hypothetical protein
VGSRRICDLGVIIVLIVTTWAWPRDPKRDQALESVTRQHAAVGAVASGAGRSWKAEPSGHPGANATIVRQDDTDAPSPPRWNALAALAGLLVQQATQDRLQPQGAEDGA